MTSQWEVGGRREERRRGRAWAAPPRGPSAHSRRSSHGQVLGCVRAGGIVECGMLTVCAESGLMEAGFGAECEAREMGSPLGSMHALDPPPPDVLLALLARNKALEGKFDRSTITIYVNTHWRYMIKVVKINLEAEYLNETYYFLDIGTPSP